MLQLVFIFEIISKKITLCLWYDYEDFLEVADCRCIEYQSLREELSSASCLEPRVTISFAISHCQASINADVISIKVLKLVSFKQNILQSIILSIRFLTFEKIVL